MDQHAIASRKGSPQKSSAFRPGGISALRFDRFTTQKYDPSISAPNLAVTQLGFLACADTIRWPAFFFGLRWESNTTCHGFF